MLNKDPRQRINAKEALSHPWFNTENSNADNVLAGVSENIANLNQEMNVDHKQMNNEEINMVTCTPLLGGRKLNDLVPQSPFLQQNNFKRDATP